MERNEIFLLKSASSTAKPLSFSSPLFSSSVSGNKAEHKIEARDFPLIDVWLESRELGVANAAMKHCKTIKTTTRRMNPIATFIDIFKAVSNVIKIFEWCGCMYVF